MGDAIDLWAYVSALTFTTDVFFQINDGALGHLWSLAVEELFYVSWLPILMLLNYRKEKLIAVLVAAIAISVTGRTIGILAGSPKYIDFLFWISPYSIPFINEMDSVAVGCLAYLTESSRRWQLSSTFRFGSITPLFCMILVFLIEYYGSCPGLGGKFKILFGQSLQCLLIAQTMIVLMNPSNQHSYIYRLANQRFVVAIGLSSYSIYLFQQILFYGTFSSSLPDSFGKFSVVVSLVFGVFIFYKFEKPMNTWIRRKWTEFAH